MPKYVLPKKMEMKNSITSMDHEYHRRVRIPINSPIMEYLQVGKKAHLELTGVVKGIEQSNDHGMLDLLLSVVECEYSGMDQREYEKRRKNGTY